MHKLNHTCSGTPNTASGQPRMHRSSLSVEHTSVILDALNHKRHVLLQFDDVQDEVQGLVLGADCDTGELLISETYPSSTHLFHNHPTRMVWLTFYHQQQQMKLVCYSRGIEHGLLTLTIQHAFFTQDRRHHARLGFQHLHGPKVQLEQTHASHLSGVTRNLSSRGAAIDFWGKDLSECVQQGQPFNAVFHFNNDFQLALETQLISVRFVRQPSCHTQVRLRFLPMATTKFAHLHYFIDYTQSALQGISAA